MPVSAYVPCFNQRSTVGLAVRSIRDQTWPVEEIFIVDDGSTDGLPDQIEAAPVIRNHNNLGRGATRALAIEKARHEFVLGCDATNALMPDFVERAMPWFDDPSVAAVFGSIRPGPAQNAASRWRARHLFRKDHRFDVDHRALMATWACVLRRTAVLEVGNFDPAYRHGEDADLGLRLLQRGFNVVADPALWCVSVAGNTAREVLERYWRWHVARSGPIGWGWYASQVLYAGRVMVPKDLGEMDLPGALLSLACPHYQFWKSRTHRPGARERD